LYPNPSEVPTVIQRSTLSGRIRAPSAVQRGPEPVTGAAPVSSAAARAESGKRDMVHPLLK
jgi:hypothetical protein